MVWYKSIVIANTQGKLIISLLHETDAMRHRYQSRSIPCQCNELMSNFETFLSLKHLSKDVCIGICVCPNNTEYVFVLSLCFLFLFHVPYELHMLITFVLHVLLFCLPDFSLNPLFFNKDRERDENEKKKYL